MGICLGNNHGNFQLHRFTTSENIAKSFRGLLFLTHTVDVDFQEVISRCEGRRTKRTSAVVCDVVPRCISPQLAERSWRRLAIALLS